MPVARRKPKNAPLSVSKLKKKLDIVFGHYIRWRDNHVCYTCGMVLDPKKSQCGHFVPRQYLATRYDERNNHCQCYACNVLYNGQPTAYACHLMVEYGRDIIEELESHRKDAVKRKPDWYLEQIKIYQEKLTALEV